MIDRGSSRTGLAVSAPKDARTARQQQVQASSDLTRDRSAPAAARDARLSRAVHFLTGVFPARCTRQPEGPTDSPHGITWACCGSLRPQLRGCAPRGAGPVLRGLIPQCVAAGREPPPAHARHPAHRQSYRRARPVRPWDLPAARTCPTGWPREPPGEQWNEGATSSRRARIASARILQFLSHWLAAEPHRASPVPRTLRRFPKWSAPAAQPGLPGPSSRATRAARSGPMRSDAASTPRVRPSSIPARFPL